MVAPAGLSGTLSQLAPMLALLISRVVSGEVGMVPAALESIVPPTRRPPPLLNTTLERFWLFLANPMMPPLFAVTFGEATDPSPLAVLSWNKPPLTTTLPLQLVASAERKSAFP